MISKKRVYGYVFMESCIRIDNADPIISKDGPLFTVDVHAICILSGPAHGGYKLHSPIRTNHFSPHFHPHPKSLEKGKKAKERSPFDPFEFILVLISFSYNDLH